MESKVGWAAPAWGQLTDPLERIRLQPVTHWVQPAQHPGWAHRDRTSRGLVPPGRDSCDHLRYRLPPKEQVGMRVEKGVRGSREALWCLLASSTDRADPYCKSKEKGLP